jgi:O-antigen ligase
MDIRNNPRLLLLHLAVPMCGDAGWFGYGPGSFKLIYQNSPYIPRALFPRSEIEPYQVGEETSIYNYVHNDYLQFIIEWGWIGAAFWAALLGGGFVAGVKAYRGGIAEQRLILAAAMIGLGGVLVHAMIDWPLQVASLQLYAGVYLALLYSNPPCAYY